MSGGTRGILGVLATLAVLLLAGFGIAFVFDAIPREALAPALGKGLAVLAILAVAALALSGLRRSDSP